MYSMMMVMIYSDDDNNGHDSNSNNDYSCYYRGKAILVETIGFESLWFPLPRFRAFHNVPNKRFRSPGNKHGDKSPFVSISVLKRSV